jgi:undecaprenyl pyrophosphate phosphatase UppP
VARWLGISRRAALKLSYFLGLPSLGAASFYQVIFAHSSWIFQWFDVFVFVLTPLAAWGVGKLCFRWIEKKGISLFLVYRCALILFLVLTDVFD